MTTHLLEHFVHSAGVSPQKTEGANPHPPPRNRPNALGHYKRRYCGGGCESCERMVGVTERDPSQYQARVAAGIPTPIPTPMPTSTSTVRS